MESKQAFNLKQWIDENRHLLKPPVGNQVIYKGNKDFIVMVCGGPNQRKDYHYNEGEELFYQIEGDIAIKVVDEGKPYTINVREGDMVLLPPKIYHSPQRPANTVGIVIERVRAKEDTDAITYFCEQCGHKLFEE